jgi:hypothetical protein
MAGLAAQPPYSGTTPPRLTWPDAAVIAMAVGIAIYLHVRDMPFVGAVAVAAGTILLFVSIMAIPRGITQIVGHLRFLREAAEELARAQKATAETQASRPTDTGDNSVHWLERP